MRVKIKKKAYEKALISIPIGHNKFCKQNNLSPGYVSRLKDIDSKFSVTAEMAERILTAFNGRYVFEDIFFILN